MSKPLIVGITGGIGSGKTLATKLFSILGVPIYYADQQAKKLMDSELKDEIIAEFGVESYKNGKLDRDYVASAVFGVQDRLKKLNAIVHPAVALDFDKWVLGHANESYVIKEAALLIESGSYQQLDRLIVITAPKALRIKRITQRDSFRSRDEIEKIISSQLTDEKKVALSNFVIVNNERELLIPQVVAIDQKIRQHL